MKIYILGICGTFMAGIALIARELGIASPVPTPTSIRR